MNRTPRIAEQRGFPRISAPVTAFLVLAGGRRAEVPVRDISASGLFLYASTLIADVGAELALEIEPPGGGEAVPVRARVVRTEAVAKTGGELLGVGLQFIDPSAEVRSRLVELIAKLLDGPGGRRRGYPRISHRIEVACPDVEKMHAVLRDISVGGAGLWLDTPVARGQQLSIEIERSGAAPLRLTGRVVSTIWAPSDAPYDQAGVQFEGLSDATRAELRSYLGTLLAC